MKTGASRYCLNAEPPEAARPKVGVNLALDLGVERGKRAPVRAGLLVVRGVEAVVEEEEIEQLAREAARVVVRRPRIGVDVLDVVEEHHRPEREERGEPEREDPHLEPVPKPSSATASADEQRRARRPKSRIAR